MKIVSDSSKDEVMKEISSRFKQYRIGRPMTQLELSERSMVSLSTIKRFENGEDISLSKLILIMEALGLQEHLELLVADQSIRPSSFLGDSKPKQRARKKVTKKSEWKWGDEE